MDGTTGSRFRIVVCLLLVLAAASFVAAQPHRFRGKRVFAPYTKNLPAVDRVKLVKLYSADDASGDRSRNGVVIADKDLRGSPAKKIAALWRNLKYRPGVSACHAPPYGIKFYSRGRLLVSATVCWSCNNIFFHAPKLFKTFGYENTQNFDADDRLGEQLYEIFRKAFGS